jgi:phage shock protein A
MVRSPSMGLLERARHLLDGRPGGVGLDEVESIDSLRQRLLEVETLRVDLDEALADLQREWVRVDERRIGSEERILECEREIQAALEADDEDRARAAIRRKREFSSTGTCRIEERGRLQRRIGEVEETVAALEARATGIRRARAERLAR